VPDTSELVQAAMILRETDSRAWDSFVTAVRRYAAEVNAEMVKADPKTLKRSQGMAIMANEFAMVMMKTPEIFEKLRAAKLAEESRRRAKP
jgi:hypothetical protein